MSITIHNYEAYFLDYTEGTLSREDVRALLLFIEQHPELKHKLKDFKTITLEASGNIFENKTSLKKPDFNDDAIIGYVEGVLPVADKREIEMIAAQNNHLKREIELYKKTRLTADESIIYTNKEKLKKRPVIALWDVNLTYLRVAAAILLLFGLFFVIFRLINKDTGDHAKRLVALKPASKTISGDNKLQLAVVSGNRQKRDSVIKDEHQNINPQPKKENDNRIEHIVIQKNKTDSTIQDNLLAPNASQKNNEVHNIGVINNTKVNAVNESDASYFNSSLDEIEDKETVQPPVASAITKKKTFFHFLTRAAQGAKVFGIKHVDAKEDAHSNVITIGGIALSETTSQ